MCFCFWKQVGDFVEIPALLRSELCCPDGRHGASQRPSHRSLWGVLQPKAFGPSGREVDQRQHGVPSAVTAAVLLCSGSGGLGVGHRVPTPGSAVGRAGRGLVRVVPERLLSLVVGSLNPFLCPSYDLISLQSCLYHVFPEFLMLCSRLARQRHRRNTAQGEVEEGGRHAALARQSRTRPAEPAELWSCNVQEHNGWGLFCQQED